MGSLTDAIARIAAEPQSRRYALISAYEKAGVVEFAKFLADHGIEIISTGGTAKALRDAGLTVIDVTQITDFPELMDGRLKTLHPLVHGGLLMVRDRAKHQQEATANRIAAIDFLVVNLYPFEKTVEKGAPPDECVEMIDIGGPAMIRAAGKNFKFVTVITDPEQYKAVMDDMAANKGSTTLALRKKLAKEAFGRTHEYDGAIFKWFMTETA